MYTQTLKLMRDRLGDDIHVDEYVPGAKLTISYWRFVNILNLSILRFNMILF